jgi:hypothetical protein
VPTTLREFATVNDAAAATTKKLQKQAALAEYFRGLDERDLRLAVRFAGGRAFAATDERVLNVGGSLVSDVVLPPSSESIPPRIGSKSPARRDRQRCPNSGRSATRTAPPH